MKINKAGILNKAAFLKRKAKETLFLQSEPIIMDWDGQKFYGNPNWGGIPWHIFHGLVWEPETTEVFIENLREGMTVLDVGAQFGYYTLLAAKRVGASGRVLAFEPKTWIRHFLFTNKHINLYDNIEIYPYALFSRSVEAEIDDIKSRVNLKKPIGGIQKRSLMLNLPPRHKGKPDSTPEAIKVVALDALIDRSKNGGTFPNRLTKILIKSLDLIKIDIEGAELDAIVGMKGALEKFHPRLIVEVHPRGLLYFGHKCSDFFDTVSCLNYRYDLIDCSQKDIDEAVGGRETQGGFHLLLTPKRH